MSDSANLGLPFIEAAQAQKHVTHNEAIALLDVLVNAAVLDMAASEPPAAPENGLRVVIGPSPTDLFSGRAGQIAFYDEGVWRFLTPSSGWLVWSLPDVCAFVFIGGAWSRLADTFDAFQNLSLLGVGAAADVENPLSVRARNALFSALNVADGGDGSLRFKLNKETAGATLSQLYQSNWSGRAETGLLGDNHYRIKVSFDGASWINAFEIDNATGQSRHVSGTSAAPGLSFVDDADTGFTRPAPNSLGFATAGVERLRLNQSGNVGLGNSSPECLLHVGSAGLTGITPTAVVSGPIAMVGSEAETQFGVLQLVNGGISSAVALCAGVGTSANSPYFSVKTRPSGGGGSIERLRIDAAGNVGVGTSTPGERLEVAGNLRANGVRAGAYHIGTGSGSSGSLGVLGGGAAISFYGSAHTFPDLLLFSNSGGERMRVGANGNVAIGVTGGSTTLHVAGPIRCGSFTRTTLPLASSVGAASVIWVTNPTSGAARAFWSNGSDWRDQANIAP